jgi:hypothetical protein
MESWHSNRCFDIEIIFYSNSMVKQTPKSVDMGQKWIFAVSRTSQSMQFCTSNILKIVKKFLWQAVRFKCESRNYNPRCTFLSKGISIFSALVASSVGVKPKKLLIHTVHYMYVCRQSGQHLRKEVTAETSTLLPKITLIVEFTLIIDDL